MFRIPLLYLSTPFGIKRFGFPFNAVRFDDFDFFLTVLDESSLFVTVADCTVTVVSVVDALHCTPSKSSLTTVDFIFLDFFFFDADIFFDSTKCSEGISTPYLSLYAFFASSILIPFSLTIVI